VRQIVNIVCGLNLGGGGPAYETSGTFQVISVGNPPPPPSPPPTPTPTPPKP
jgi:hypothetical protein